MSERPPPAVIDERLTGLTKPVASLRLNLLVYGASGVGKTVLAGSAEDDERTAPVLYVDVEGGLLSISQRGDKLDVFRVSDFRRDMTLLESYLRSATDQHGKLPYRTIVIDSLTRMAWLIMADILRQPNPKRASKDVLEYSEWNILTNRVRSLVMFFTDLNAHLICTALEREDDSQLHVSMPGRQTSEQTPSFFNTVARLSMHPIAAPDGKTMTERRRLQFQKSSRVDAKDRSDPLGMLPHDMDYPSVSMLLDRIAEGHRLAVEQTRPAEQKEQQLHV